MFLKTKRDKMYNHISDLPSYFGRTCTEDDKVQAAKNSVKYQNIYFEIFRPSLKLAFLLNFQNG